MSEITVKVNGSPVNATVGNGDSVAVSIGTVTGSSPTLVSGTIEIGKVTTLAAGSQATVTNSGTGYHAILDLGLPKGDTGSTGATGEAGPPASLSIGTVTSGSTASATITGNAPSQVLNLVLPQGIAGSDGANGSPNTLTIGTVTTGDAGTKASATISGTAPNQTLSLTIPRGDTGSTGSAGPANSLSIGTVTTGAAGSSASATITGTSPNQTLSLTIPRGDAGAAGSTGATGATGPSNSLSIGTVTSGTTASATITGTAPDQTLNLVLPKGDQGATGQQGQAGSFGSPQTISAKTASYTLQLSDVGSLLTFSAGSGTLTVTIPAMADVSWVAGSHIDLARIGAATVTVAGASGVGVTATPGLSLRDVGSGASLVYLGSDAWLLVGDLA